MHHVVMFSGGAASYVAAKRAICLTGAAFTFKGFNVVCEEEKRDGND